MKWLKRPKRGRKVEEGTSACACVITPSLCLCQAYYLISLVVLHYDRGSSELKASLQKLILSETVMKKSNQTISGLKCGHKWCWLLAVIEQKLKGFYL